ncbi:MAG TPA: VOC family protein [Thermoplasmata archaeon]|nr:VOC family protein [Thermoplasmata archaeon]
MDTPKPSKNRLHLDVDASGGRSIPLEERRKQIDAEVKRLVSLGATKQLVWEEVGWYSVVMLDPEGNEFCVR